MFLAQAPQQWIYTKDMAYRPAQTHLRNSNMLMLKLAGCGSNPNSTRSSTGKLSRPHPKLDRKNAPTSMVSEKTCHSKSLPNGIPKRHEAMTFNELIVFQPFRMSFLPAKVNAAKLNAASGVPHSSKTSRGGSHFAATPKNLKNPQEALKALKFPISPTVHPTSCPRQSKGSSCRDENGFKSHWMNMMSTKANGI